MAEHQEDVNEPSTTIILSEKDTEQYVSSEEILKGAVRATDDEHAMTLMQGIRKYPKAVFWSVLFSSALIMEGFDHAFISGFFAFPAFQQRYGVLKKGKYQIPAEIQAGITNGVNAGEIIGLLLNGLFSDWFGYRWVMIASLALMMAFIALQFSAKDIYMYLGAEVLLGVPWGVFQTLTTTYAAEVCPNVLRPYLTMLVSLSWSIGYLLGTSVLRGFLSLKDEWAYRIPFALQWAFPVPIAIGVYLAPESPWWLIRKGRSEDARKTLRRLRAKDTPEEEIADTVSMMVHTVKIEDEMKSSSSYIELFKNVDLRRTEITLLTYLMQAITAPLVGYIVYFLEQAGLAPTVSFDFAMGQYSLAIVGVFVAWSLVPRVGRRTLLLWGMVFMTLTTLLIGFLGIPGTVNHPNLAYGIGSILLVEYFVFFITIGPLVYTIVTEIPSNYLRNKSVVAARALYNVSGLVYGQIVPRSIQITAWNWGAKSGFFYGGVMGLGLIWVYFRLPETKDRTFAEVDILFKNKVKARDFSSTKVDLATETVVEQ